MLCMCMYHLDCDSGSNSDIFICAAFKCEISS